MSEWISVKENHPLVGELVLFCGNGEFFIPVYAGYYCGDKSFYSFYAPDKFESEHVTHYMRFPNPPEHE